MPACETGSPCRSAKMLPVPRDIRPDNPGRVSGNNASLFVECLRHERPHPDNAALRDRCSLHQEGFAPHPDFVGYVDVFGVVDALASIAVKIG